MFVFNICWSVCFVCKIMQYLLITDRIHSLNFAVLKGRVFSPCITTKLKLLWQVTLWDYLYFFFFTSVLLTAIIKENPHFFVFDNFQFALWNGQSKYTWFLWQINMLTGSSLSQRWQFRELASLKQYVLWQLIWVFEKFFLIIFMLLVASLYSRSNKD